MDDNQQPLTNQSDQLNGDQAAVDDFDDFAEEQDMGEDDFGDFDDGFQEPSADVTEDEFVEQNEVKPSQPPTPPSVVSYLCSRQLFHASTLSQEEGNTDYDLS